MMSESCEGGKEALLDILQHAQCDVNDIWEMGRPENQDVVPISSGLHFDRLSLVESAQPAQGQGASV